MLIIVCDLSNQRTTRQRATRIAIFKKPDPRWSETWPLAAGKEAAVATTI